MSPMTIISLRDLVLLRFLLSYLVLSAPLRKVMQVCLHSKYHIPQPDKLSGSREVSPQVGGDRRDRDRAPPVPVPREKVSTCQCLVRFD